MAEKRMVKRKIIDTDCFLEMPLSAQALYFHLIMRADDDGFIDNPRKITKYINASEDDLKILIAKRYLIAFESGVIVIKHWRMHNTLQSDRYHPTYYQEELAQLGINSEKEYTKNQSQFQQLPEPKPSKEVKVEPARNRPVQNSGKDVGRKMDPAFVEFADGDEDLLKALEDFAKMRKETGSPMNFSSFLSEMTHSHMSKTNYTVEAMVSEANDCFERVCDECADRGELADFKELGSIEHIRELIQAEKDRRMVVLPFTIGTTLYRVATPYRKEPKVTEFIVTNFVMRGKKHELMVEVRVNGVPGTNIMKIKSFYRTREEAEAALKGDGEK